MRTYAFSKGRKIYAETVKFQDTCAYLNRFPTKRIKKENEHIIKNVNLSPKAMNAMRRKKSY